MEWTEELDKKLLSLKDSGMTYEDIAKEMDTTLNSVAKRLQKIRGKNKPLSERVQGAEEFKYNSSHEVMPDGSHKSDKLLWMDDEKKKDVNFLLQAHGYDPEEWELISARNNIWNTNDKENGVQTLYSSTIKAKPRTKVFGTADVKEIVNDLMKNYQPPIYKPLRYDDNGRLLEVNISDLHLNKLGYKQGEYDHNQAKKIFFHVINDVMTRTQGMKFEKVLFIWSHDFFNIDNLAKTTTGGTPQDVSQRYSDMYKMGKRMLIEGIDLLRQIAPLETVQVGANHDRLTSYTMSEVLDAWYRNDENVTIDNDPLHRKYRRFGKCLIGFSHGDKEKKRLGKVMPSEARQDWGETLFSEIHAAHLHSEQAVKEENGVIVRYLSSPSGTDTWHFESGYVESIRKTQSFIWDKELGLTDILHTTITPKVLI
ncbi:hypothetical protein BhaS171_00001 [Bacillus phage vB_BhaS-171]|uniref:DNA repair exonuclease n=1 Tax=Bacillus phage vB_BhaS-171 TaxID=1775140 RepID=UPI000744A00B|nr:DNA repair exonuclease [Bacillus phage vB_BhaS-171]ALY08057.1 hypothetical protein BhaS171_00001 [Bacillus phage vB_BhaS-171]